MLDLICDTAPFCIARDYAPAAETTGMFRKVDTAGRAIRADEQAVQRLGVRIQVVSNDFINTVPAKFLRQTCADGACVVFRMACDELTCSWQAAPTKAGPVFLKEIRLTATSAEGLAQAKTKVFVSAGGYPISLAQLDHSQPAPAGDYAAPVTAEDQARRAPRRP
ncbi:hypothetical protein [Caulobacter sp.]|uniref:hypothetical protein n=1 Tax=Caulobacter sp. TaxID=78 RepID=UPI001B20B7AD|nr:hypothetical protein [Caulobacter sp.]MBO9543639.1 hypothetical protein [Caulobacter sp.]